VSTELLRFLAHARELEAEAMTRYEELGEALQVHNNPDAAAFFLQMATESAKHLEEVEELIAGRSLPDIPPWEFDWQADAPESASYEALHYRMDMREALLLALANERSAQAFYAGFAESAGDPDTVALARQFADEESEHARLLEQRLASLPESPRHGREDDDAPQMPE
jgi:rubrerythrin